MTKQDIDRIKELEEMPSIDENLCDVKFISFVGVATVLVIVAFFLGRDIGTELTKQKYNIVEEVR